MKPVSYYNGWNDALDVVYKELWEEHRELAISLLKHQISWPRIEADERLTMWLKPEPAEYI